MKIRFVTLFMFVLMGITTYAAVSSDFSLQENHSTPQGDSVVAGINQDMQLQLIQAKNDFLKSTKEKAYSEFLAKAETASIEQNLQVMVSQPYMEQLDQNKRDRAEEMQQETENSLDVEETVTEVVEDIPEPVVVGPLVAGYVVDPSYTGSSITLNADNRYLLERLVMGEAGNQGFVGAALVAQTIHDTMIKDNNYDVMSIKISHAYSGKLIYEPNQNVLDAVAYIFDQGGMAVQHRLVYFYAPARCSGTFHETQLFVVEYGGHRFFDEV